jgi:hypothetical protein
MTPDDLESRLLNLAPAHAPPELGDLVLKSVRVELERGSSAGGRPRRKRALLRWACAAMLAGMILNLMVGAADRQLAWRAFGGPRVPQSWREMERDVARAAPHESSKWLVPYLHRHMATSLRESSS